MLLISNAIRVYCFCQFKDENMGSTANQRVKNQRQARLNAGWQEVRVWVPTKNDACQIQELAAKLRARALDRQRLEQLPGVKSMDEKLRKSVIAAVENQGSAEYATPSGAFLELLSELAKKGCLDDMAAAFGIFVEAHPSNARFVAASVGAKVMNHYFIPCLGLNGASKFIQWQEAHPNWAEAIAESLQTGAFRHIVDGMLNNIKKTAAQH